jgi:hypothetical protein
MLTVLASEMGTHLERWAPAVVGSAVVLLTLLLPPALFCISWLYWRVQQMHSQQQQQQQQQVGALPLLSLRCTVPYLSSRTLCCVRVWIPRGKGRSDALLLWLWVREL